MSPQSIFQLKNLLNHEKDEMRGMEVAKIKKKETPFIIKEWIKKIHYKNN